MPILKSVPLKELKTYGHWFDAPTGTLLQVCSLDRKRFETALRCEMNFGGSATPTLLFLDDDSRGLLLEDDGKLCKSAVDVSSFIEIVVKEPAPVVYSQVHHAISGIVCEQQVGSGAFLIRAKLQSGAPVLVWIADPSGKHQVGEVVREAPDLWVIGECGVAKVLPPTSGS